MDSQPVGIGLIGCGIVGGGVARLLIDNAALYARRVGRPLELRRVLIRAGDENPTTDVLPEGVLTTDADDFFSTDGLNIVAELAGGTGAAKTFVERAVDAGLHVVTANKALMAAHGVELFARARNNGVAIAFEASCGGGIPFITALQHNLAANRFTGLYGILNGTSNYILTQMVDHGWTYDQALGEAQQQGYAEADPTLDVSGGDAAHKLAILASLAFGAQLSDAQVPTRGIDTLEQTDITLGDELGYVIKLLAIAEQTEAGLSLEVAPCFIDRHELLAKVSGSFNAISLFGDAVGQTMYYGRGAGRMPTASAVVGDICNLACGAYPALFGAMQTWSDQQPPAKLSDPDASRRRYYLRINALDVPGVVAKYSAVLGELEIGIAAVSQHEVQHGQFVPVVVITHNTAAGAMRQAIQRIGKLDVVQGDPVCLRIVDLPEG